VLTTDGVAAMLGSTVVVPLIVARRAANRQGTAWRRIVTDVRLRMVSNFWVVTVRCSTVAGTPDGGAATEAGGCVARTPDGGTATGAGGCVGRTPDGGTVTGACARKIGPCVWPCAFKLPTSSPTPRARQETLLLIAGF
jgi:hypothetical protein